MSNTFFQEGENFSRGDCSPCDLVTGLIRIISPSNLLYRNKRLWRSYRAIHTALQSRYGCKSTHVARACRGCTQKSPEKYLAVVAQQKIALKIYEKFCLK